MSKHLKRTLRRLTTPRGRAALRAYAHAQGRSRQAGFNLIEIMVAIAIIGVLMAVVGVNVLGALDSAKIDASKGAMNNIKSALIMYKLDNGRYPTTSEGLQALISAPGSAKKPGKKYLDADAVPRDGWDNEFAYFSPGTRGSHEYEIISYGADGQEGGQDAGTDINSWEVGK